MLHNIERPMLPILYVVKCEERILPSDMGSMRFGLCGYVDKRNTYALIITRALRMWTCKLDRI